MAEKKMWKEQELVCKPLDTYSDIIAFLQEPPPWRSLCVSLKPHSENGVKNIEINSNFGETLLETPQTFCHYDPEVEGEVRRQQKKKLPKTLVCHDMANGYHDDCIIDGTSNYDAYTFYNWGGIDIFCYFSHHLITIPPLAWINVGHAHGVKVIGTIITEWSEGVAFWDNVLSSEIEAQNFANALVAIAKILKFDGWLLNVENKITKPDSLLEFVRYLHKRLHEDLEHATLIWYDSVTIEGHLTWQNALTQKNKAFFDVVDGFFTNYSWSENDVASSMSIAGDRLADLFIGIDVWGRNFYGGGQFNTQEAIQLAHEYGCSLAIFAPAWTHEAIVDEKNANTEASTGELSKYEIFLLRDRAFWGSIWPYLNTSLPCVLPFQTSFCRGQGKKRRLYGEVVCPRPWYNLRHMQYQPNSLHGPHGYLLSTQENIKSLSAHGIINDKAALTRYRRSLEANRQELFSDKSKERIISLRAETPYLVQAEQHQVENNRVDDVKHVQCCKMKVNNYFRHLFRLKTSKNHQQGNQPIEQGQRAEEEVFKPVEQEPQPEEQTNMQVEKISSEERILDLSSMQLKERSMFQVSINIRLGHLSKTRYDLAYVANELECLEPFFEDSFTGGSCLKINPSDEVSTEHRLARIFHCDFYCETSLIACVVTKTLVGHESQYLNLKFFMTDSNGKDVKVVLVGHSIPHAAQTTPASSDFQYVYPSNSSSPTDPDFRNLQRYILLNEPGFYTPVENSFGWRVRYYEITMPGARLTSINCRTGLTVGPILLGYFGLCNKSGEGTLGNL